jgi:hypothetical protein
MYSRFQLVSVHFEKLSLTIGGFKLDDRRIQQKGGRQKNVNILTKHNRPKMFCNSQKRQNRFILLAVIQSIGHPQKNGQVWPG